MHVKNKGPGDSRADEGVEQVPAGAGSEVLEEDDLLGDLMNRAQDGCEESYRELLIRLSSILGRYVGRRVYDKSQVDDVVQDILIAVHSARATYQSGRPFGPWVYAIARYKTIDFVRKQSRIGRRESVVESSQEVGVASCHTSSALTDTRDVLEQVTRLPENQRLALEETKLKGKTIKQVAEETGMSEAAVKVYVHRAIGSLRKMLEGK